MNCPKCATPLAKKSYKGFLEVDSCPACRGFWLDFHELDTLEDTSFDNDPKKGSLIHRETATPHPCPICQQPLLEFQYRLYDLRLDFCATHQHGFWLDYGEEQRILEIMRQRATEIERKTSAETEWRNLLTSLHTFFRHP